jgi:predicted nucleic-acid-binding protein
MRAVDANVLVRLLTRDDAAQVAAAEAFIERGAWISHIVLTEATSVLTGVYDRKPDDVAAAIEMLLNHRDLVLQEPAVIAEALALFRKRPALGFSDCLVVEVARKAGCLPIGTFDRALAKVDGAQQL